MSRKIYLVLGFFSLFFVFSKGLYSSELDNILLKHKQALGVGKSGTDIALPSMIKCIGRTGYLTEDGDSVKVFLKSPIYLRTEEKFRIRTCNGAQSWENSYGQLIDTTGRELKKFKILSMLLSGTLLFEKNINLKGELDLGSQKNYLFEVTLKDSLNLAIHVDRSSFLINQVAAELPIDKTKIQKISFEVYEYMAKQGRRIPSHIAVYEIPGTGKGALTFKFNDISFPTKLPESDSAFFEKPALSLGELQIQEKTITGTVINIYLQEILTNIRLDDLKSIGVQDGQEIEVTAGSNTIKALFLIDLKKAGNEQKLVEEKPVAGFLMMPVLLIGIPGKKSAADILFCKPGDQIILKVEEQKMSP